MTGLHDSKQIGGEGRKEKHKEKKETYLHMIQTQKLPEDFNITMIYMFKMREKK